ncbi:hypothetical protein V1511DRAFT_455420 [Dipodascopsis uninucleata]
MDFGLPGIQALQAQMMPQIAGAQTVNGLAMQGNHQIPWAITKSEKKIFDDIFEAWDGLGRGFISGDTGVEILSQSGLQRDDLVKIWTLSDPENRGRLNKSEFSVAMHLVYRRLNGYPIPAKLPPELVPPSTRNLSESVSTLKNMLKSDADQRRNQTNMLQPQATGVSYMKARSFRQGSPMEPKKDATVYKNNDDEVAQYVSSARHRSSNRTANNTSPSPSASSTDGGRDMSKAETLEYLRKQIREKQILINAIDAEDDLAFDEDQYLKSRDRTEADDLIRKIKLIQEDIDEYQSGKPSIDVIAERNALRNQLQYLTDRLPILVGRARSLGNKISDAKLELFRIRDAKDHPGQQIIGTGPGGRITEADKRKARSMAVLQARMAALTGKPTTSNPDNDEQAAEARLAEITDKIRIEKDGNEQMIHDVEESVKAVQESLDGMLRESRADFERERERQRWEEGIGAEDEVKDLILEMQRHSRIRNGGINSSTRTPAASMRAPYDSSSRHGDAQVQHSSAQTTSIVSSSLPMSPSQTGSSSHTSRSQQYQTPQERAAWIKAEAERRMNERLAAMGISRPPKTSRAESASSSMFSPPVQESSAFSPPVFESTPQVVNSIPSPVSASVQQPQAVPQPIAPEVRPSSQVQTISYAEPKSSPPVQASLHAQPKSKNPFPVQEDYYFESSQPHTSQYEQVNFDQPVVTTQLSVSPNPSTGLNQVASFEVPSVHEPDIESQISTSSHIAPVASAAASTNQVLSVETSIDVPTPSQPSYSRSQPTATTSSNLDLPDRALLETQRKNQRGHITEDDDDWSVVPSESENSSDDDDISDSRFGVKKPSPADLASLLFGNMAASHSTLSVEPSKSATPYESASSTPAPAVSSPSAPLAPPIPQVPLASASAIPPAIPPVFGAPAPAPPPPPALGGTPPVMPAGQIDRNALLGQIQAGRALKKVQTVDKSQAPSVGRVL